ncbi:MAG: inosose dehydratase [Baekduia sp.]|nr:inosose dehydratase [Baekduia sp.]
MSYKSSVDPPNLAGAPISWGVCEAPGWGAMLSPSRVLGEMAGVGLRATELGPVGDWLPLDGDAIRAALQLYGLTLVGGFVPLALHVDDAQAALERARVVASAMSAAGADTFVLALVADEAWSTPAPLDPLGWRRVAGNVEAVAELTASVGMTTVIHPHHGTMVERLEDIDRLASMTDVAWCLDPGHLGLGGYDPLEFAWRYGDRIGHVHLKDLDLTVAAEVAAGRLSLMAAVQAGLFVPLGEGDARIGELMDLLAEQGYDGWMVLEQDCALVDGVPADGAGPVRDVAASLAFLGSLS